VSRQLPSSPASLRGRRSLRTQSGVATLLVVMGLFFVVSMVAAYASRNLIFEQRTSANQYRSTQAFEAAEAGIEWALGMLNGGRIDAQCAAAAAGSAETSFRQRYVPDLQNATGIAPTGTPGCQLSATGVWTCGCPGAGAPAVVNPAGGATQPAYRVRFRELATPYPGFFNIESRGCTSPDDACLNSATVLGTGSGAAALVAIRAAMVPTLAARPQAAVTVGGDNVDVPLGKAVNTEAVAGGLTIQSRVPVTRLNSITAAGSAAPDNAVQDPSLPSAPGEFFTRFFGMPLARFATQPITVRACASAVSCSYADVLAAWAANPGRPVWVEGNLDVDSTQPLGSAADPVLLIVGGALQFSADASITGVVYSHGNVLFNSASNILGAVITAGTATGSGAVVAAYDRSVIDRIRATQGTIVRVPGGWRDF
jgi:Tfp pilus assembly protein PilX